MPTIKFQTRKDKLVLLSNYYNLETEEPTPQAYDQMLYDQLLHKKQLDRKILNCRLCRGLNIKSFTQAVCGWGNINADIFFIGESPCVHSMTAQMPFAWKSGAILDTIIKLSGLTRYEVFISNAVHCHLTGRDKPDKHKIRRCRRYLRDELDLVNPQLVVTLGNFAKEALAQLEENIKQKPAYKKTHARHPASFLYSPRGAVNYILKLSLELDKYT